MGPPTGTTAGCPAAVRLRGGPQSAAWRFPLTLSDVRAGGAYGPLRRKRLKTVCAAGIRKSAMQAPQRRIFRKMVHTGRLRKPDGGAGVRRNDLTVNRVTNEVAQPFFNLWAERRKKRAERRGGGLRYAGAASGSSTMAATILAFISLFPAFKAVPDHIRRPVGICTYRKRALQRY